MSSGGAGAGLRVEFCGEAYTPRPDQVFCIGREGDLEVDSNPFLHRRFLEVSYGDGLWWLANVGSLLSATVADDERTFDAWLGPGASLPIVCRRMSVWFTAGATTYEIEIVLDSPPAGAKAATAVGGFDPTATAKPQAPSREQRKLLLALAEPVLLRPGNSASEIPGSAEAARRLGWTLKKFNRKLDLLCEKFARQGVRGLHGEPGQLATNRRARLVEYALSTRLVSRQDLALLDGPEPDGAEVAGDDAGSRDPAPGS